MCIRDRHRSGINGRGALIGSCEDGVVIYQGQNTGGGYRGYESLSQTPDINKLMKSINITYDPSSRPNGKSSWYSGAAFTTLQKLTEDLTNQTYPNWMKSNILDPMGMTKSRFTINPEKYYKANNLARGHKENGDLFKIQRYPQYAAAGLYSNSIEMANMIIMLNNKGVFKQKRILSALSCEKLIHRKSHLGINVSRFGNYYHGGTNTGFRAYFVGFPNMNKNGIKSAGIVVLTNGDKNIRMLVTDAVRKVYGW